jgi:hypothetical protein
MKYISINGKLTEYGRQIFIKDAENELNLFAQTRKMVDELPLIKNDYDVIMGVLNRRMQDCRDKIEGYKSE